MKEFIAQCVTYDRPSSLLEATNISEAVNESTKILNSLNTAYYDHMRNGKKGFRVEIYLRTSRTYKKVHEFIYKR